MAAAGPSAPSATAQPGAKPAFVLVHPAWHGGWCWRKVVALLRASGHDVWTPTLSGLGERLHLARRQVGLGTHIDDVVNVLKYEGLSGVILVGHSSSGMVVTGVADRLPQLVSHVVYLDAFLAQDGQALVDLLPAQRREAMDALVKGEGDGWLLPRFAAPSWERIVREFWGITDEADVRWMLARLVPTPYAHFTEPVRRINAAAEKLPRTYIRCARFPNAAFDRFAEQAKRSTGWRYRMLDTSHHPYVTRPRELAALLLEAAAS
jgi:pimeloyl-ACP methyl ester carboxylesterase